MMRGLAVCIGCGCDDDHACEMGCYWLHVDYAHGVGVCSECSDQVERWVTTPYKKRNTLIVRNRAA
jgi:hypothetical protein